MNFQGFPVPIKIVVNFEGQDIPLQCDMNDKFENCVNKLSTKINVAKKYLIFLYGGKSLGSEDFKKPFKEIMHDIDKNSKEMNMVALKVESQYANDVPGINNIRIFLVQDGRVKYCLIGNKNEPIINIIRRGNSNINSEFNKYTFKYGNNDINLNQTFDDIADEMARQNKLLIIMVSQNNLLFQNRNNTNQNRQFNTNYNGNVTTNNTLTNNSFVGYPINDGNRIPGTVVIPNYTTPSYPRTSCCTTHKDKIIKISVIVGIIIVAGVIVTVSIIKKKSKDKDNSSSSDYGDSNDSGGSSGETKKTDEIIDNNHTCNSGYYIPEDDSTLKDCQKCSVEGCTKCSGTYKSNICHDCGNLISVYKDEQIIRCNDPNKPCEVGEEEKCKTCDKGKNECTECNIAYKLVDGYCKPDYFIKAVYLTKQKEDKIDIINSYSDIAHIFVEGKNITLSSTSYQFQKEGNQTVYFQFKDIYYYNSQLFKNNKHIKSISFSDFDEYKMGISLSSLFAGCTNLTSVDFSKLSYVYTSNMDHMLDGCINLTYINISNLKVDNNAEYMFNNCKLLKSINLSKLDITKGKYLNNMFTNCTSLQTINLKGFKLDTATTINSMFYNCYSLKSLDLSAFKPTRLTSMYSSFYNCSSLTSINFLDFYSDVLDDLRYLFYNCSSLKEINLNDFNIKNVRYMERVFEGCKSLTSIITGPNFELSKVENIASMFAHCHSLKNISFDIKITNEISSLSSLFSDCYSLTSVNLKNFDTTSVKDFNNMFHNCYNLKNIDITNFYFVENCNIKNMFSGCYSITSIDFSSIKPNFYRFNEIFYDCPNLNFVNFSFIHYRPFYYSYEESYYIFNTNISKNGILILNEEYYNKYLKDLNIYPPDGWTLNFTN